MAINYLVLFLPLAKNRAAPFSATSAKAPGTAIQPEILMASFLTP